MPEIRAFVGHSFAPGDATVVDKFLKFLTQVSGTVPGFSWAHAEDAEPRVIAEKVIALLGDKNVFIGICTKSERVIPAASLKPVFWRSRLLAASEDRFSWKTSDWIIQEIGLAIGRKLELILLIEDGVRNPGGLQSNVEYIPFERGAPEKSFGKILEMIKVLSPPAANTSALTSNTSIVTTEDQLKTNTFDDDSWSAPQPSWNRRDYEIALMMALAKEDDARAEKFIEAYLRTADAAQGDNRISWEARVEYVRLKFGKGGSFDKLKALADAHPDSSAVLAIVALAYQHFGDNVLSAKAFETAAQKSNDRDEQLRLYGSAAVKYARAKRSESCLQVLDRMKDSMEVDASGEVQLLRTLRDIAEIDKEDDVGLSVMERLVDLRPSDIKARFSLAFKHSECGNADLALAHYNRIPDQQREPLAWNNLGVARDHFSLPVRSVAAYRKAEEMGETLAMSNLAQKLLKAGFDTEAQQQCDKALQIKDYHKNIGAVLLNVREAAEEEEKKEVEIIEKAEPKSAFYRRFGHAVSQKNVVELNRRWVGPDCVLTVRIEGNNFLAEGSYEREIGGIGGILAGLSDRANSKVVERYEVKYSGSIRGKGIETQVSRARQDSTGMASSLLGIGETKTKALLVLNDDGDEFRVMEFRQSNDADFYTLTPETGR